MIRFSLGVLVGSLALLFSGCATTPKAPAETAYMAVHANQNFTFRFANFSGGSGRVEFKSRSLFSGGPLRVAAVDPGKYALVYVESRVGRVTYTMRVPVPLMELIHARPGQIVYLGKFNFQTGLISGRTYVEFDADAARNDLASHHPELVELQFATVTPF